MRPSMTKRSAGQFSPVSMLKPCGGGTSAGVTKWRAEGTITVAACSAVSAMVFMATHRPLKRDSAMPARPNWMISAASAGCSTGIITASKIWSVWCGKVEEWAPWSSPAIAQHAAVAVAAEGVGDPQRVGRAVHAGSLAVPHGEHAVLPRAGEVVQLLRAGQHGDGQVLVQAGLEVHAGRIQQPGAAPQLLVQAAERGAAVAGHQAAGVQAGGAVQPGLFQQHADQGLDAGEQHGLVQLRVAAFEGDGGSPEADIHGVFSRSRCGCRLDRK